MLWTLAKVRDQFRWTILSSAINHADCRSAWCFKVAIGVIRSTKDMASTQQRTHRRRQKCCHRHRCRRRQLCTPTLLPPVRSLHSFHHRGSLHIPTACTYRLHIPNTHRLHIPAAHTQYPPPAHTQYPPPAHTQYPPPAHTHTVWRAARGNRLAVFLSLPVPLRFLHSSSTVPCPPPPCFAGR